MSKKIKKLRKLTAKANERVMAAEQEFINCQNEFEVLTLELKEAVEGNVSIGRGPPPCTIHQHMDFVRIPSRASGEPDAVIEFALERWLNK